MHANKKNHLPVGWEKPHYRDILWEIVQCLMQFCFSSTFVFSILLIWKTGYCKQQKIQCRIEHTVTEDCWITPAVKDTVNTSTGIDSEAFIFSYFSYFGA